MITSTSRNSAVPPRTSLGSSGSRRCRNLVAHSRTRVLTAAMAAAKRVEVNGDGPNLGN